jgi:periplasmic protein TonB
MAAIMAHRISRGTATLIALGVQGVIVLALMAGLINAPAPPSDAAALSVEVLPSAREIPEPPPSKPKVHLHLIDPGAPPEVPVEIAVIAPPEPPPDFANILRMTDDPLLAMTAGTESEIGIVSRVEPKYPQAAVDERVQGTTSVAILVDTDGHPGEVRVLHTSGDPQLDEAAVRAVRKWTFTAATAHSQVVPAWGRLDVNFSLGGNLQKVRVRHRGGGTAEEDAVARLAALIKSWGERRGLELLNPKLSTVLQELGVVRTVRFVGIASRPPQRAAPLAAEQARMLDATSLTGWEEFEVTQQRGTSQWYCAVDAAGHIQGILVDDEHLD